MAIQKEVTGKTKSLLARPAMLVALGLAAVVVAASLADAPTKTVHRGMLVGLGMLAGAAAITVRVPSPRILLAAALVPFVASLAVAPAWDTVRLVLRLVAAAGMAGAVLLALPQ